MNLMRFSLSPLSLHVSVILFASSFICCSGRVCREMWWHKHSHDSVVFLFPFLAYERTGNVFLYVIHTVAVFHFGKRLTQFHKKPFFNFSAPLRCAALDANINRGKNVTKNGKIHQKIFVSSSVFLEEGIVTDGVRKGRNQFILGKNMQNMRARKGFGCSLL